MFDFIKDFKIKNDTYKILMFTSICISKVVRSDLSFLLELSLGVIKMIFFTELLSLLLTVYLYLFENGQAMF